jgi:electron transport complex protein RnfB
MQEKPPAALTDRVDALLPQTQCRQCGFDGCRPYAAAIAAAAAPINRCPPGGEATLLALSQLIGVAPLALDPSCGTAPAAATVALIDEQRCIGCFKCIDACPVDAIVGAAKRMHTVIAAECSGCGLCVPPCPVDCIDLMPRPAALPPLRAQAGLWRRRHRQRLARLERERLAREAARRRGRPGLRETAQAFDIAAAIARARGRRTQAHKRQ